MVLDHSNVAAPRLRRRLIPLILSLLSTGAMVYPVVTNLVSEKDWLQWSLLILSAIFTFLAIIFFWMRQTMVEQTRRLTIFGVALVDFFGSIVLATLFLVYLFFEGYLAVRGGHQTSSFTVRLVGRSGLVGACVFIMSTGVVVAYEMRKAKGNVRVHQQDVDDQYVTLK